MIDLVQQHFECRGDGIEFLMEAGWVRNHIPAGAMRIADVGCGIGALIDTIGPHRAIGVDYLESGLHRTRARYPRASLLAADAINLPFADGSLDVVTAQHVIEHLADARQACREWRRVLRPGGDNQPAGRVLILTPNRQFADPSVYDDETHVHIYDANDLSALLRDCGFDLIDLRTLGLPWFRRHHRIPGGWRYRRWVVGNARFLSRIPACSRGGQTLCCAARRAQ